MLTCGETCSKIKRIEKLKIKFFSRVYFYNIFPRGGSIFRDHIMLAHNAYSPFPCTAPHSVRCNAVCQLSAGAGVLALSSGSHQSNLVRSEQSGTRSSPRMPPSCRVEKYRIKVSLFVFHLVTSETHCFARKGISISLYKNQGRDDK